MRRWHLDTLGGIGHRIIAVRHGVDFLLAGAERVLARGAQATVRGAPERSLTVTSPRIARSLPRDAVAMLEEAGAARRGWLRLEERCVIAGDVVRVRGRPMFEIDPTPSGPRGYRGDATVLVLQRSRDVELRVTVVSAAPRP